LEDTSYAVTDGRINRRTDGRSCAAPRPAFAFDDAGIISNLLIIGGAHLQYVCGNQWAKFLRWRMKTVGVTDYTNYPPSKCCGRADGLDMGKRVNLPSFFCQLEIFYGQ